MKQKYTQRVERLIQIAAEIKNVPYQTVRSLLEKMGISRSQFYKDRQALADMGFEFEYSRPKNRFVIIKDAYLPVGDLTFSERLSLIMAFRHLAATGEQILSYEGFNAAKKIALELPRQIRESLFEDVVLKEGFGSDRDIMKKVQNAIEENRRVILSYQRPEEDEPGSHEADLYHLYFRRRALYAEGHSLTENGIRAYRLSRISKLEFTPCIFTVRSDYDFGRRHRNAFSAYAGDTTEHVVIRFRGKARTFVQESMWHHSQMTQIQEDDSLVFEVDVAYPREVMWWSLRWGADAEILKPEWLREEAQKTIRNMGKVYEVTE